MFLFKKSSNPSATSQRRNTIIGYIAIGVIVVATIITLLVIDPCHVFKKKDSPSRMTPLGSPDSRTTIVVMT